MEVRGRRYQSVIVVSLRNKSLFAINNVVKDFSEKRKRLRRNAVMFAGDTVQPVKFLHGFNGI